MSVAKHIPLVVACDDHYLILLAALLKSIEKNHHSNEPIDVYVVEDNVSFKNQLKLEEQVRNTGIHLKWIPIASATPHGMNLPVVNNSYPLNTFVRLFIPHFIPLDIQKIIFLDVDMIVLEDISKLWSVDISGYTIGAVRDSITKTIGNGIDNFVELGLNPQQKYFNAGLQLIDTRRWVEEKRTEQVIHIINNNKKYARLGDQYGLNAAFSGQWFEIDPMWNYFSDGNHPYPNLIHYFHRKPFYKTYSNNYQDIFYQYLDQTPWRNTKPVGESIRYLKKISNVLPKWKLLFSR